MLFGQDSSTRPHVKLLIVGATGLLGRPVARRLVQEGFDVRAFVRDTELARTLLPGECELVAGDVRDEGSLKAGLAGVEAVYINLAPPFSKRRFDPEHEGCKVIAQAAKRAGVTRLLKISALEALHCAEHWWAGRRKAEADEALINSGLNYTIFRPTWFMESIPLFMAGKRLILPKTPDLPLHWIAGDDYARQVAAALRTEKSINRIYTIQGPEPVTFREAAARFAAAYSSRRLKVMQIPMRLVKALSLLSPQVRYLDDLLKVTFGYGGSFEAQATWDDLGRPMMSIEDYVRYLESTGDVPRK